MGATFTSGVTLLAAAAFVLIYERRTRRESVVATDLEHPAAEVAR
jgi:hypothetical protein